MGGEDPGIPAEVVSQFRSALDEGHVPNEVITYPGAPHSFFDRKHEEFTVESADAWKRVLSFVGSR
jgi:carboxymethylenebutenolidase